MCRAPANPVSENPGAASQSQPLTPRGLASDPRSARESFPGRGSARRGLGTPTSLGAQLCPLRLR